MLEEADLGMTAMAHEATSNRFHGDENLYVKFYTQPKQDTFKSKKAGRPIYVEREYVQIMVPGNKDSINIRPVRDMDRQRFPKQYAAFLNQEQLVMEGTPLSEWPGITRGQCQEMKYFNVHTVEQLAAISDSNAQKFMGFVMLRDKAKAYLVVAGDQKQAEALDAAMEAKDVQIAELTNQMMLMQAQLSKMMTAQEQMAPNMAQVDPTILTQQAPLVVNEAAVVDPDSLFEMGGDDDPAGDPPDEAPPVEEPPAPAAVAKPKKSKKRRTAAGG